MLVGSWPLIQQCYSYTFPKINILVLHRIQPTHRIHMRGALTAWGARGGHPARPPPGPGLSVRSHTEALNKKEASGEQGLRSRERGRPGVCGRTDGRTDPCGLEQSLTAHSESRLRAAEKKSWRTKAKQAISRGAAQSVSDKGSKKMNS